MTINTSSNKSIVLGNGSQTQFAFGFIGVAAAFISVIFTDANGNETVLGQGSGASQYQIVLNSPVAGALWGVGGTVTYDPSGTPIAAGTSLTIFRTIPLTQAISLQNLISLSTVSNGAEMGLDMLEMQLQQVSELFSRAIVAPIVDPDTIDLTLPAAAQRANLVLGFDGNGDVIATATPASGTISSAMQPVVNAASLAAGRTALGLGAIAVEGIGAGLADDGAGNVHVVSVVNEVATNQAVHAANHTNIYAASGALVFTLDRANTLFDGFEITVYALTGAIIFNPNASDNFFGQSSGVPLTIPKGSVATLLTDGAASGVWYAQVTGISPVVNVQEFTATGVQTYTASAGLLYAVVELVGGGGGAGGCQGALGVVTTGGGGGGSLYARSILTAAQIGNSQTVTVGVGGSGGGATGGGGNGASSSFGDLVVAAGGRAGGGGTNSSPGVGGIGGQPGSSTGNLLIAGEAGATGFFSSSLGAFVPVGKGGSSRLGFGAPAVLASGSSGINGIAGQAYGGGGSAGQENNQALAAGGGAGAPGIVLVTEYLAFAA
jgi:hypothetical protein